MSNVTGTGTTYNLPNFSGDLFTASPTQTPFLSMIGGFSGGMKTKRMNFQQVSCMSSLRQRSPQSQRMLLQRHLRQRLWFVSKRAM